MILQNYTIPRLFCLTLIIGFFQPITAFDFEYSHEVFTPTKYFVSNSQPHRINGNHPNRDDLEIIYEYGFEDGWNDWSGGDPWEISDEDAHDGQFSAHCPVGENQFIALVSPGLEIPDDGSTVIFDFWVNPDMLGFNPDQDMTLDDYFLIEIRTENGGWEDVLYDYYRFGGGWMHYVSGTWWRNDQPNWRMNQDLTRFAGQTIQLRWILRTDDSMDGDQGSGLWIDDFRLFSDNRCQLDAGVEWMHLSYPNTIQTETSGWFQIKNFGRENLEQVRTFSQMDDERMVPVVPWRNLESGASEQRAVLIRDGGYPYNGLVTFSSITQTRDDENTSNDSECIDILVYPAGMWMLGYDDRKWTEGVNFDQGTGPAVLFTPAEDNMEGVFDLKALEILWSGDNQDEDADIIVSIFADNNGQPGDELYSGELTVTPQDLFPNRHYIDLSEIEALNRLRGNFWVWLSVQREDGLPRILGRQLTERDDQWAENHFYSFDGERTQPSEHDYQLHAILANSEMDITRLCVRPDKNFGEVSVTGSLTLPLTIFGGGNNPVTVDGINIEGDDVFEIDEDIFPIELRIGETAQVDITFLPDDEGEYQAEIAFECNDEEERLVAIAGIGAMLPVLIVEPAELDFGRVEIGESEEAMLLVINEGQAELEISDIQVVGDCFRAEFQAPIILDPDWEEEILISFEPPGAGDFAGELHFISNDPNPDAGLVLLTGNGIGGPEILIPIPDLILEEDFDRFAVADLDTIFTEPNDLEMTFSVESSDNNLICEIDETNVMWMSVSPDWSGVTEVCVFADNGEEFGNLSLQRNARHVRSIGDHPHRDIITELFFNVTVNPVNDLPSPFRLLQPENDSDMINEEMITFEWSESIDEVEDSTITYVLEFTFNDSTRVIEDIRQTSRDVTRQKMGFISDEPIVIQWFVFAFDGIDYRECDEPFSVIISPLDISKAETSPLPVELILGPIFPNPFNDRVIINYAVPTYSNVTLTIHDLTGRAIRTIVSKSLGAGRHSAIWNGIGDMGFRVASGLYICKLEVGDDLRFGKVLYLR